MLILRGITRPKKSIMIDDGRYLLGAGAFGEQFVVVLPTRILAQSSAIAVG